jgi:ferredoxin-type protein NapH
LRRPSQLAVILVFCLLPWANAQGWTRIYGSLFALNIYGLPFADPLSALQVLLLDGHFSVTLWTGAALVLLAACALGRVFCGWLCPCGLLSELVYALRRRLPPLLHDDAAVRHAFGCRLAVCLCGLAAAFFCGFPVLQRFSMPGELSLSPLRASGGWEICVAALLAPGAALLAEGISGRRVWCRWLCPQSVCLSLAARCFPGAFGVKWTPGRCTCPRDDRPCRHACSLGLAARQHTGPPRSECIQCGQCVSACAERGAALRMALYTPST